jgi:hypothetical protein
MSFFHSLAKALTDNSLEKDVKDIGSDVGKAYDVGNDWVNKHITPAVIDVGTFGTQSGGGGKAGAQQTDPQQSLLDNVESSVKNLTEGQLQGPAATALAATIAKQLQGLSPTDAQKVLALIPAGSTLSSDLAKDIPYGGAPPATPSAQNDLLDPLSLGKIFSQNIAPWIQQQQAAEAPQIAGLNKDLQQALSTASPQVKDALGPTLPALNSAESGLTSATNAVAATAPEMDNLIQALAQYTTGAKAAQYAQVEEPYIAQAVTGLPTTTAATTTGSSSSTASTNAAATQSAIDQQYQQMLAASGGG